VWSPNAVHQADLCFLPHNKLPSGCKVYKYALIVVDVTSRYKEAEPLTLKDSAEVVKAFQSIYKHSPLMWPQMPQVDPGHKLMGSVTKEMENLKTYICHGALEFTETKPLLSVSTAQLPSDGSVISIPWKCSCLLASSRLRGSKGFSMLLRH